MTTLSSDTLSPTKRQPELNNVKLDFPVVGIGASAGGIQATLSFFEHMPSDSGMAFVVIMHLSPDHKSGVDKVLQGVTSMPVQQVTGPLAIEPNHSAGVSARASSNSTILWKQLLVRHPESNTFHPTNAWACAAAAA